MTRDRSNSGDSKISVAFCCLGNICRSPMAEAVLRHATLEDLKYMQPRGSKSKIMLFGAYCEDAKMDKIISDPYYGGPDGFQSSFRQPDHFSRTFLKKLAAGTA
ncbi:low molecular weight phosphotyrosine protein phosphatase [Lipomyces starkeyi]